MPFFSRLFGKAKDTKPEPVHHAGFRIYPDPIKEAGGFRIAATIEKDIEGETRTHRMIRADTYGGLDAATEASLFKARQVIDQLGDTLF